MVNENEKHIAPLFLMRSWPRGQANYKYLSNWQKSTRVILHAYIMEEGITEEYLLSSVWAMMNIVETQKEKR